MIQEWITVWIVIQDRHSPGIRWQRSEYKAVRNASFSLLSRHYPYAMAAKMLLKPLGLSAATSRVVTPASGSPTQPGRRSPSARVLSVISDSLVPYRSTGRCPAGPFWRVSRQGDGRQRGGAGAGETGRGAGGWRGRCGAGVGATGAGDGAVDCATGAGTGAEQSVSQTS